MGIEIINEPNTTTSWPMMNVTERYKAVDPELAEGTGPIAFDWLKDFYVTAYHRLRDADKGALPADKAVVFHDGFDIELRARVLSTSTAKDVTASRRVYRLRGDRLETRFEMAAVGQPMTQHLASKLVRSG